MNSISNLILSLEGGMKVDVVTTRASAIWFSSLGIMVKFVVTKSSTSSTSAARGKEISLETTYGLIIDQFLGHLK